MVAHLKLSPFVLYIHERKLNTHTNSFRRLVLYIKPNITKFQREITLFKVNIVRYIKMSIPILFLYLLAGVYPRLVCV